MKTSLLFVLASVSGIAIIILSILFFVVQTIIKASRKSMQKNVPPIYHEPNPSVPSDDYEEPIDQEQPFITPTNTPTVPPTNTPTNKPATDIPQESSIASQIKLDTKDDLKKAIIYHEILDPKF